MSRMSRFFHGRKSLDYAKQSQQEYKDAHDDQYALCEARRDEAFQKFQAQSEQEFLKAEKAQGCGEHEREETFNRMITNFRDIFDANQQRRELLYREADLRQEAVFQTNDNKRESVFQAGQTSRAAMYEEEEAARNQLLEWFRETRASILIEGRQAREKICNDIDAEIGSKCESLLQAQEDEFLQKEHERDTIVQNLAAQTRSNSDLSPKAVQKSVAQVTPSSTLSIFTAQSSPHAVPQSVVLEAPLNRTLAVNKSPPWLDSDDPIRNTSVNEQIPPTLKFSTTEDNRYSPQSSSSSSLLQVLPDLLVGNQERDETPKLDKSQGTCPDPAVNERSVDDFECRNSQDYVPPEKEMREKHSETAALGCDRANSPTRDNEQDDLPKIGKHTKISLENYSAVDRMSDRDFESRFRAAQHRRSQDFAYEENLKENRFKAAELERDGAESERTRLFEERKFHWQDTFQVMLQMQETHYHGREQNRADVGHRRDDLFHITQDRHDQAFVMSIYNIEKRIEIEDSLEELQDKKLKHRVDVKAKQENGRLEAAAEDQWTRFATAQLRRRSQLGVTSPSPILNQKPNTVIPTASPEDGSSSSSDEDMSASDEDRWLIGRLPTAIPPGMPTVVRPCLPSTGFAVNVLLKGTDLSAPLPIPKSDVAIQYEIHQKSDFETVKRRHQVLFKQSQSRREESFQRGMERRHHAFSVNEQRRAFDFEKKQRSRQATFEENEEKHERSFSAAQQQQETEFWAAEHLQEVQFRDSENSRHHQFKVIQEERAQNFYAKLQELQMDLFVRQERGLEDLKIWSTRLLEECVERGNDRFWADEAERDKSFHSMLLAACHNNTE